MKDLPEAEYKFVTNKPLPDLNEDLSKLTLVELKNRSREKGLRVTGNKQELINRLKECHQAEYEFVIDGPNGAQPVAYPAHVRILQLDGTKKPTRTHKLKDAVKMLGFYHSLNPEEHPHVKEMVKKGVNWVDKVSTRHLPPREVWMGFFAQILPGIN